MLRPILLFFAIFTSYATFCVAEQTFQVGVCTHFGQGKGNLQTNLSLIQQAGMNSIRDEVPWAVVERQRGQYAIPAAWDSIVNASLSKGLQPLLILDYGNPLYDGGNKPTSDAAIAGYVRYAEFVVQHFKGRVHQYEVFNEWDGTVARTSPGSPEGYVKLLKAVYPRLKAIDPNVEIIGGAVTYRSFWNGWFQRMLDAGALTSADAISIHPYVFSARGSYDRTPEAFADTVSRLEDMMRRANGGRDYPLYVTEVGWPTHSGIGSTTADEAGAFLAQTVLLGLTMPYLKGIWWYDFQDDGTNANDAEQNFGLVRYDLTPKPGFAALPQVMRWLKGATIEGRMKTSDATVDGVKFRLADGQSGMAMWRKGAGSSRVHVAGANTTHTLQHGLTNTLQNGLANSQSQRSAIRADSSGVDISESPVLITGTKLQVQ